MQYFRFLPDPAKRRKEPRWSGVSSDGTFKIRVGYEVNAAADIIRRNQGVPYFLRRFAIRDKYWCASGHGRKVGF
jgi:hypothetical protein